MAQVSTSERLILDDGSSVYVSAILPDIDYELGGGTWGTTGFSDSGQAWTDSLFLEGV